MIIMLNEPSINSGDGLKNRSRNHRVLVRYALLQLPEYVMLILVLGLLWLIMDLPGYAVWGIVAFWVVKDIILYPFVGRFYDPDYRSNFFSMIGLTGIAQEPLIPTGYIQVKGELWKAEVVGQGPKVNADQPVIIRGIDGLKLLVHPEKSDLSSADATRNQSNCRIQNIKPLPARSR